MTDFNLAQLLHRRNYLQGEIMRLDAKIKEAKELGALPWERNMYTTALKRVACQFDAVVSRINEYQKQPTADTVAEEEPVSFEAPPSTDGYFIVKLMLRIGDYEKHTVQAIQAQDEAAAETQALENETHNTDDAGRDKDGDWWDDYMIYQVYSTTAVDHQTFKTVQQYL